MNRSNYKVMRAQAELHHAHGAKVKQIAIGVLLLAIVLGAALTYIHIHYGYQIVMLLLMFIAGVVTAGTLIWLGGVMNDRSQQALLEMMLYIRSGISEILKQEARTHGELDRSQIRVWTHQQLQDQRVDASRQITQERRTSEAEYVFDDDQEGMVSEGRFREIS